MTKVTIVINKGMVEAVYSNTSDVDINIIDLDVNTDEDYEAAQKALYETRQTMQCII